MKAKKLSNLLTVIMPAYNEESTIRTVVSSVLAQREVSQLIIVNDGSSDRTAELLEDLSDPKVLLINHEINKGKGASIRSAIPFVDSHIILIQDADLEYDPRYYPLLLQPILEDRADVVYGSRFLTGEARRVLYFWHYVANKVLTILSNMTTNLNLSDMETGFKVFRSSALSDVELREERFGFEPEITKKLSTKKLRFFEVSISYNGRTYAEGKKIGIKDAFRAIYCIFRYMFS